MNRFGLPSWNEVCCGGVYRSYLTVWVVDNVFEANAQRGSPPPVRFPSISNIIMQKYAQIWFQYRIIYSFFVCVLPFRLLFVAFFGLFFLHRLLHVAHRRYKNTIFDFLLPSMCVVPLSRRSRFFAFWFDLDEESRLFVQRSAAPSSSTFSPICSFFFCLFDHLVRMMLYNTSGIFSMYLLA